MKHIIFLIFLIFLCFKINANEILDENVLKEQLDEKQSQHWIWCGKKCRSGALSKAKKILKRMDNIAKKYETHESFYLDSSDMFKRKATKEQWKAAFMKRNILGSPLRRIHESTQGMFKNLPKVDKNEKYIIVSFDTMFEGKKGIFSEQITLIKKKGKFKFLGYYYVQKPYYEY